MGLADTKAGQSAPHDGSSDLLARDSI